MKTPDIIHYVKDENVHLDIDSVKVLTNIFSKRRKEAWFKRIEPSEARSTIDNSFYWTAILKIMAEWCGEVSGHILYNKDGSPNYNKIHRFLTLFYAIESNNSDMITITTTYHNGDWIDIPEASTAFKNMTHKQFQDYKNWCEDKLKFYTGGAGFDTIIEREKLEVKS